MIQLAASILALGVGPTLDKFSRPGGPARAGLDAFTFVAMLGLILGHIIPDAFALAGWQAILIAGLAWFGPTFFEHRIRSLAQRAHSLALFLGALGLIIHGTADGIGLVAGNTAEGWSALAVAVILHRVPAGLTLWWLIRPKYGRLKAQLVLIFLGLTTILGFLGAEVLQGRVTATQEGLFKALVGGALLHVVMHRTGHTDATSSATGRKNGAFVGSVLSVFLLSWMFTTGEHQHSGAIDAQFAHEVGNSTAAFVDAFLTLARESAPALVIAFTMAGVIQVFLPKSSIKWMSKGSNLRQSLKGVAFGLPLPICSCGVVPLYRSLATRGVPVAAALAFLVATPELGIDAVLLSLPLLGVKMTIARVVAAALVAVIAAWVVARCRLDQRPESDGVSIGDDTDQRPRIIDALKIGWVKFFDTTAPWIVLGLVVAAICQPLLPEGAFDGVPGWLQVPMFAIIGVPIYVCASGATPLVAVLLLKGVSPGAALAFLLTGPATNITTFGLLRDIHGKKLAIGFVMVIVLSTVSMGWLTNTVIDTQVNTTPLHADMPHDHENGLGWDEMALLVLTLGFALSIYRQGPQGFVSHVFSQTGEDADDHKQEGRHGCCEEPPPEKKSCCH